MAKIAFIDVTATVSYGGIQTAIWELARALTEMGHEITIVSGEGGVRPEPGGSPITVMRFPYRPRQSFPNFGTRFRKLAERVSLALNARAAVASQQFDWVILTKPYDFIWPWLSRKESGTHFAFMSGGTDFFRGDKYLSRKIAAWVACSHFNAWQIKSRYNRFPKVMYNGVDTELFRPAQVDVEGRHRLHATLQDTVFAFAGRLVGWKGMEVAIRAMADPILRNTPAKLLIIGDGPHAPQLKRLSAELNISERIIFYGPIPHRELPSLYANIDVGVFPSIADEAFGITIAEAMSCGKPVIASYIGGIPEVVGNENSAGLLVPPGDPQALAQAMYTLAADSTLRKTMGSAAHTRITELYTWKQAAARLLNALDIHAPDLS